MKLTTAIIQVFDPAMCCSTGACGPDVDPKLVQFAADLEWLKTEGVLVERQNLSQNPKAFVENELVGATLAARGGAVLPILLVNGKLGLTGRYPERGELAALAGVKLSEAAVTAPAKSDCGCDDGCC